MKFPKSAIMQLSKKFPDMLLTFSKWRYYDLVKKRMLCSTYVGDSKNKFQNKLAHGPKLEEFMQKSMTLNSENVGLLERPPYLLAEDFNNRCVYIETYGCQMNVNDTEIVNSILQKSGYIITTNINDADVIFVMTCAIREGAEQKIWKRLKYFRGLKKSRDSTFSYKVGVLGCMAERLKHRLLEKEKIVDIVAGPDSYKDLPNLLSSADEGQKAVNVMLSVDETYADIMPVRMNKQSKSAFVSIMRGCDNMCSYCIVPFTRGKERSRPISSILDEVKQLSDQGYKEITLLGQNVNSYRDLSEGAQDIIGGIGSKDILSSGFHTVYKNRFGGLRFAELLNKVADVNPEIRIRFTSPHPKDFPDDVLHVINERSNICKLFHLPAQSGNSEVLERMRRGYTREAYLELADHIKDIIPGIAFTSDFITGFCGESEDAHQDTLLLISKVKYEFVFVFPYSMREKTKAFHRLIDDVPEDVKKQRAEEVYKVFQKYSLERHQKEIGKKHLVQVIGPSKRSNLDWSGRNDWNTKVIFPFAEIPDQLDSQACRYPASGDYIVVEIDSCSSQVVKGKALYHTTLQNFYSNLEENQSSVNVEQ